MLPNVLGMGAFGQGPGLTLEAFEGAFDPALGQILGADDLDGHSDLEMGIVGLAVSRRTALAELFEDLIATQ